VIAEHYFETRKLRKPLRELSAEKAVQEMILRLKIDTSPRVFEKALRRLGLVA